MCTLSDFSGDEGEVKEAEEEYVELLKAREDSAEAFEPKEELLVSRGASFGSVVEASLRF